MFVLLTLGGCGTVSNNGASTGGSGSSGSSGSGSSGSSGSSGTTSSTGDSSGFTFATTDFYVDVNTHANTTSYLHLNGDWTKSCDATAASPNQDLVCLLEIQEEDLYDLGLTFAIQAPTAQCSYLRSLAYFYYQYQTGLAPTTVNETITDGGTPVVAGVGGDTGGGCGAGSSACLTPSGTLTCSWDYSYLNGISPGPNCCEGSYTLNVTTVDDTVVPPTSTTTTTVAKWSGMNSNCLNGPATASTVKDAEGYPEHIITFLDGQNLNNTLVVAAPITFTQRNSNTYASNYWEGPYTVTEANPIPASVPLAFWPSNPAKVGLTTNVRSAQPWYEWECLDEAGDIINRERVLVRSWSTHSAFAAEGTAGVAGPEGVPFSDHDVLNFPDWILVPDSSPPYNGADQGFGDTYPGFDQ